ncbi:MAG: FtsX-like permease family protein [Rhodospirillaceae bacterium]|nr:FtsX-like permease family protein [Rhodospirillaceae bacterium]
MTGITSLLRLARWELVGGFASGFAGFRVLLAGLTLGVAAVAASGTVVSSVEAGLAHDARALLGGDVEVSRLYRPAKVGERALLATFGTLSEIAEVRVMARRSDGSGRTLLSEFKAVDAAYPLIGTVPLDPPMPLAQAFAEKNGLQGVAVASALLARLGLNVGDSLRIGTADFQIRARILAEPDATARVFALGPRILGSVSGLEATGLIQPGSLITHATRIAAPAGELSSATVKAALSDQTWRVRGLDAAAPGTRRFLETIARFLSWAGLSALLVGGVGVASAVSAVLEARRPVLAILKSHGATNRQIVLLHALIIGAVSSLGIIAGLGIGAIAPWPVAALMDASILPAAPIPALYPIPLLRAAAFGAVIAALFTWWPLLRARDIPAATLFQDVMRERTSPISITAWCFLGLLLASVLALAAFSGDRPTLGLGFALGAAAVLGMLRLMAKGVSIAAHHCVPPHIGILGRLALANLARRRGPLAPMMVALGLGATVLVALTQVQGNVSAQVGRDRGADHPSYFFIDIQPDQAAHFTALVKTVPGASVEDSAPMVRGRVVKLNGIAVDPTAVDPAVRWVLTGDRGFTSSAKPPRGADIVAGQWWADRSAAPLVSVEKGVANGLDLKLGDTVTVNILGRDITATVANLRAVRWTSLAMNFAFVFSPGVIDAAPHTRIATVLVPPDGELPLERTLANALPNVSGIRVADVLERIQGLSDIGGRAVLAVTGITVLSGLLVLGGAVSAGLRERLNQAVILKVLGARRSDLMRVTAWEFLGIGVITGIFAVIAGSITAWSVVRYALRLEWAFRPEAALWVALLCVVAGLVTGGLIAGRVLSARPARRLRHL